jgi:hypothetical protein
LRISDLESYLAKVYKAGYGNRGRVSVLLLGAPGIGKSITCYSLAQRIAKSLGKEFLDYNDDEAWKVLAEPDKYFVFIDFRLTECEPSDLLGIPKETDGAVRFSPLLWARCLSKSAGLLLLDELTNVQRPDVITSSYKLIFDRKAGFTKFHDDVMIVACGNRPEESSVASMLPVPLISRMLVLVVEPPTVQSWADWMTQTYGDDWDKRTYAFLKRFEDEGYLIRVPMKPETLEAYPVPRTWSATALLMHRGVSTDDTLVGLLGYEVGTKLQAFLKVDVDIEELIRTPEVFTRLDLDGKYMVSVMLGTWISKHIADPKRAYPLIDSMSMESREFLVLTCMSMEKKSLVQFLRQLFTYQPSYKDVLSEIAIKLKEEISGA